MQGRITCRAGHFRHVWVQKATVCGRNHSYKQPATHETTMNTTSEPATKETQELARKLRLFTEIGVTPPADLVLSMLDQIDGHLEHLERILVRRY